MKIVLLLHCTTTWNQENRWQGQTDIPLTNAGTEEAKRLAEKLADLNIESIVSSPLRRAAQTAEIVGGILRIPVAFDHRLRECSFGSLEGKTVDEVAESFGEQFVTELKNNWDSYDFEPFGGERGTDVGKRQLEVIRDLQKESTKTFLLIGHSRSLNTVLAALNEVPNLHRNEWRVLDL